MADAEPASFTAKPTETTLSLTANPRTSFQGFSDDGNLLAVRIPKEPADSNYTKVTGVTAIGRWVSGRFIQAATSGRETSGTLKGRQRQAAAVVQAGNRLVWVETPSTDLQYNEWSIRTVELPSGAVREVAHSTILKGGDRLLDVTGGTRPVVIQDWVYWATAVPTVVSPKPSRKTDWTFDIQRARLSKHSPVETVAQNAVMPTAAGDALVYAAYSAATADTYEIHRKNVADDQADTVLVRGYRSGTSWITNLAASGTWVTWSAKSPSMAKEGWVEGESAPGEIFVLDISTNEVIQVVTQDETGGNGSFAFTRRGLVWGNGSGSGDASEYVLDLGTGKLQKLGESEGLSEVLAQPDSDTVMWVSETGSNTSVHWNQATLK